MALVHEAVIYMTSTTDGPKKARAFVTRDPERPHEAFCAYVSRFTGSLTYVYLNVDKSGEYDYVGNTNRLDGHENTYVDLLGEKLI